MICQLIFVIVYSYLKKRNFIRNDFCYCQPFNQIKCIFQVFFFPLFLFFISRQCFLIFFAKLYLCLQIDLPCLTKFFFFVLSVSFTLIIFVHFIYFCCFCTKNLIYKKEKYLRFSRFKFNENYFSKPFTLICLQRRWFLSRFFFIVPFFVFSPLLHLYMM